MKTANVAELKKHLSSYLEMVERGEEVCICRRNVPIARLVSIDVPVPNRTVLGCGEGTVTYHADVTEPMILESSWDMLSTSPATDNDEHSA